MLTEDQKYKNQMKYLELISRLGIDMTSFTKYLLSVDYFNKPATTQYAYSYDGGLCEQALKLCIELSTLCEAYFPGKYKEEDIIKVALFKELYRAEMYEVYNKNVKNDITGQWEQVKSYRTKEVRPFYGDLGFSSYMIAKQFVDFTDEQIEAIIHAGGPSNYSVDIYNVLREYPLVALTRMADTVVNYLN